MSYEGYVQYWCKSGHYWAADCYSPEPYCPICKEKAIFENGVDETNCESVGFIFPELREECICPTCKRPIKRLYKIPKKEERNGEPGNKSFK